MRKYILSTFFLLIAFTAQTQIVTLTPAEASGEESVKVVFDATKGTGDLVGASKVYIHSGVVTTGPEGTDWEYVIGNWGMDDGVGQMSKVSGSENEWEITLDPTIREYFSVDAGKQIFRLAMVFRNADGSKKGAGTPGNFSGGLVTPNGDIYLDLVVDSYVQVTKPEDSDIVVEPGNSIDLEAVASATAESLSLSVDAGSGYQLVGSGTNIITLESDYVPAQSGLLKIKAEATISGSEVENIKEVFAVVSTVSPTANIPAGVTSGINYIEADETSVILSLLAPGKDLVYVVGDFTNWEVDPDYLMNVDPDGERFWLEIPGLTPQQEYVFQYWVDGIIKIGDPFADKVADPWNDKYIPESVYPDLPEYNKTEFGIASVLQTGQPSYAWEASEDTFVQPEENNLIVYELLVRDFLGSHDYKDLVDTLGYLKTLGVNAIELMPIMEFEGNESWGYNPAYFFAPDKYYGSKDDLKRFIEVAHQEGFAVILDMVLNHAFGSSPMVGMYWDSEKDRPSVDNPWFNVSATHPFNVGYDFNHESQYTKDFVDSVNLYWLKEYHFDGFRFDLSKGFTQTVSGDDVGKWGQYDQSRVDILTRMAERIWEYDSEAYVILEHFADPLEDQTLADEGMILWGNLNHTYSDVLTGSNPGQNISGANSSSHITYMESHDEQRQNYYVTTSGIPHGAYDIRNEYNSLERMKLGAAFFFTVPGPKLTWQFQELGYDIDINFNGRVGNKPLPWGEGNLGYYEDLERQKLYGTISSILKLRNDHPQAFTFSSFEWEPAGNVKWIQIEHADLEVVVLGNFGLEADTTLHRFTKEGTWYDYLTSEEIAVTDPDAEVVLQPGEFHLYVDRTVDFPTMELVGDFQPVITTDPVSFHQKESVKIVFDAEQADPDGTSGLVGAEKVYMHSGVILDPESNEWSNTVGNLGADDGIGQMQKVAGESDKWEISIVPETYYGIDDGVRIFKIALYFRDAANENRGKGPGAEDLIIHVEADPDSPIVWTEPEIFSDRDEITIFFDATVADPAGTAGLVGVDKVYMHSGTINDSPTGTSWDYVIGNWGEDDGVGQMTKVPGQEDKWQITLTPRDYYQVPGGTPIYRLGMVFRNEDGSKEGKGQGAQDIFINVEGVTPVDDSLIENEKIHVYPNPARDQVRLSFHNRSFTVLRIFDATGRLEDRINIEQIGEMTYLEYSTATLADGIHFFELSGKNGKRETARVLINR